MKKGFSPIIMAALFAFLNSLFVTPAKAETVAPRFSIVPKPAALEAGKGEFALTPETVILVDKESKPVGDYLSALLAPSTGATAAVKLASKEQKFPNAIVIEVNPKNISLGNEGYTLDIAADRIVITAAATAGSFYGVQTLRQLFPPEIESRTKVSGVKWAAPCVKIEDMPRLKWRGLMLDSARHFFPKEFVLKYIDYMALFKFNTLHMHLVDDQGWRLEIKKYPNLTNIGSKRGASKGWQLNGAGKPHKGFYTQDDMREIIAYAAARHITIVPEIEMPGHAQAALASEEGLACTTQKFKVRTEWGVNKEIFCAGNDKTFEFLENVLTEVAALFPGEYIHIGGDEVPKDRWKECAKCQARIMSEGLKDESELQSWFITRMEKFVNSKGKKLIGWDEIIEGGLPPRATVMSWRGMEGGIAAARTGHDVVMSPTSHCYFDYLQALGGEPRAIGGFVPLCRVYSFEPVPKDLTPEEAEHIIGVQGNLWTEYIDKASYAEYMAYPRAAALAEVGWTPASHKDWNDFTARMKSVYIHMDVLGINYRKPKENESDLCEKVLTYFPEAWDFADGVKARVEKIAVDLFLKI
ncbi:MAG: beta-N-acetylhexosaminidase [bacterium]